MSGAPALPAVNRPIAHVGGIRPVGQKNTLYHGEPKRERVTMKKEPNNYSCLLLLLQRRRCPFVVHNAGEFPTITHVDSRIATCNYRLQLGFQGVSACYSGVARSAITLAIRFVETPDFAANINQVLSLYVSPKFGWYR
jgi:hypothetical protein